MRAVFKSCRSVFDFLITLTRYLSVFHSWKLRESSLSSESPSKNMFGSPISLRWRKYTSQHNRGFESIYVLLFTAHSLPEDIPTVHSVFAIFMEMDKAVFDTVVNIYVCLCV